MIFTNPSTPHLECEWEGLPQALEKLLISNIRKIEPDEHIVVTLSCCDGLSYFAFVGEVAEWILTEPAPSLRASLEYAQGSRERSSLPESVFWIRDDEKEDKV